MAKRKQRKRRSPAQKSTDVDSTSLASDQALTPAEDAPVAGEGETAVPSTSEDAAAGSSGGASGRPGGDYDHPMAESGGLIMGGVLAGLLVAAVLMSYLLE